MSAEAETDPLAAIGAALDNPAPAPELAGPGDPGPDFRRGKRERPPFPRECPVTPLGMSSGLDGSQRCFYLNINGEIVGLEAGNRHGKNSLIALFGDQSDWLEEHYPQWSAPQYEGRGKDRRVVKDPEIVGFDQAEASRALIEECSRRGIFEPTGRLRGRGAHPLKGGGIVMHFGDALATLRATSTGKLRPLEWHETGLHERYVYPAAEPLARPWPHAPGHGAPLRLVQIFGTWQWKRPLIDVRLLLGGVGQAFIGGYLDWRSNIWITGGAGTGKSSLNGRNGVLPALLDEMLFRTGNASAAAIRQSLRNATVPVMLDEIEPGADNRKQTEAIELARVSSSGDKMHRGGQDHQAHEFTLQSPFWFSSINIPPLEASDRSRLAILELKPFPEGTAAPDFSKDNFADMGRQIMRLMLDGLPRFAQTLALYRKALAERGHSNRACDQFGTLLACADLLLDDELPDEEDVRMWAERLAPDRLAEVAEAVSDEERCLTTLLTSMTQPRGNAERDMIGTMIGRALHVSLNPDATASNENAHYIEQLGLKLVNPKRNGDKWGVRRFENVDEPGFLAVAASHEGLGKIFAGTKWQGGVWKQTLARVPGAKEGVAAKFGRLNLRCVLVPLHAVLDESELPEASKPDQAAAWMARHEAEGVE